MASRAQPGTQGAAGLGLALLFGLLLASLWQPASQWSFIGLSSAADKLLAGARVGLLLPVLTGVAAMLGFGMLAAGRFRRVEL